MASEKSRVQDLMVQLTRVPELIESPSNCVNDLALLPFCKATKTTTPSRKTSSTRRASAVSAFRQKKQDLKLDLGVLNPNSSHNFFKDFSHELDADGIFAATGEIHPVGTSVSISFEIPGHRKVHTRGVVRYTRDIVPHEPSSTQSCGMGISFTYLEKDDKAAIEDYQKKRKPFHL
ncbi:MAG: hypothetical protein JXR76_06010 [Deltaproteobacteria bacterium]|nr:hypothetical protein [Deltaproteobacteria bacterium]